MKNMKNMKRTLINLYCVIIMFFAMTSCSKEKEGSSAEEFGLAETWVALKDNTEYDIVSKNFYDIDGLRTVMTITYKTNDEFGKELYLLEFAIGTPDNIYGKVAPNFDSDTHSLEIKNNEGKTLSVPVYFVNNNLFIKMSTLDYETVSKENAYVFTFMCYSKEISIKTKLNNGKEYTWKFNSFVESK